MNYSTVAIIYNPNSTGSSESMAKEFAAELQRAIPEQSIDLIATEYAGHAEKLAYDIATSSNRPLIISSSGDGGYHEVINGAMQAQAEGAHPTTSLLPAGNANDHYRNLHDTDLIEQIISGKTTAIDLLKLSSQSDGEPIERYAHSYIGFGLTPLVGKELNKVKLSLFIEFFVVARALFTIKPVRLKIGPKARSYESVIFSNVDEMSKYLKISQPSSVHDGKFEVTIFKRRNKLRLIMTLLKASLQGVQEDQQVSEFTLSTVRSTLVQADGEIIRLDAKATVAITVAAGALTCVV